MKRSFRNLEAVKIDHWLQLSPLYHQFKWLELAGFCEVEVHFMPAGHALFSGWSNRSIGEANV